MCSQLDSQDKDHLYLTVLTIAIFLMEEAKDSLKNDHHYPKPLSAFAKIINDCGGLEQLKKLNKVRVEREDQFIRALDRFREDINVVAESQRPLKPKEIPLSDTERMIEEILVLSFGFETRLKKRKPSKEVMARKMSFISCIDCKKKLANSDIFSCGHVTFCNDCAAGAVHKVYTADPKKCSVEGCGKTIPASDCPWYLFRSKRFKMVCFPSNC